MTALTNVTDATHDPALRSWVPSGEIRGMVVRLDNFASELSAALDRAFVDHRFTNETLPSMGSLGAPSMPAFSGVGAGPLHVFAARA